MGFWRYKVQERMKVRKCVIISYYTQSGNADVHFVAVLSFHLDQCVIKYPRIFMKTYFCIYVTLSHEIWYKF